MLTTGIVDVDGWRVGIVGCKNRELVEIEHTSHQIVLLVLSLDRATKSENVVAQHGKVGLLFATQELALMNQPSTHDQQLEGFEFLHKNSQVVSDYSCELALQYEHERKLTSEYVIKVSSSMSASTSATRFARSFTNSMTSRNCPHQAVSISSQHNTIPLDKAARTRFKASSKLGSSGSSGGVFLMISFKKSG